jgi:hypothetical protein
MSKTPRQHPQAPAKERSLLASLSPTQQDLVCVVLLYVVTLVLFRAIVFENAAFQTEGDTANAHSYYQVGTALTQKEGEDVLWMPFFFSGMPTFGNVAFVPHDVNYLQTGVTWVLNWFFFRQTWTWLVVHYFMGALFMFLLMRRLGFGRLLSLFGALTFLLSPYAVGLAGEGHGSKLMAVSYLPAAFLLTHMLFERRDMLTFGLLAATIGTLMLTNHMQIVYYVFLLLGLYIGHRILLEVRSTPGAVAWKTVLFAAALLIGFAIASYIYLSVYQYSQYSIRGGGSAGTSGGLNYDYATGWSWHPLELITLFIPGFYGLKVDLYWGSMQPWTNSSVYVGVLPVVLSLLVLVVRRTAFTLFLWIATLLAILLAMGNNFPLLYDLFFSVLPFFNKFRAPVMILHLLPFTLGILGAYGLSYLVETHERFAGKEGEQLRKKLLYLLVGLVVVVVVVLVSRKGMFDAFAGSMLKPEEVQQLRQQYGARMDQVLQQLPLLQKRFDMMWKDMIKLLVLSAFAVGVYLGFLRRKMTAETFLALALVLLAVDLFLVANKFIEPKPSKNLEQNFAPDATARFLQQQPGLFRVFPLGQLFMDNTLPYNMVQSIGGYSPAKLKIYQTMLDSCMYKWPDQTFPLNPNMINMLNVEYLVVPGRLPEGHYDLVNMDETKREVVYRNAAALPRAWYVGDIATVGSDAETFARMNSPLFDPRHTALLTENISGPLQQPDSTFTPTITKYQSREIVLHANVPAATLLVLSEIYYPAGWKAFVDGQETPIHRTNYVLRSVVVPAGDHQVVFRYDPPLYALGRMMSGAGWGIAAVCMLIGLVPLVRKKVQHA